MELKKYVYYHTGAGYVDGYDNLPEKRGDDWRNLFTAARKQYGNNDGMLYVPTEGGGFVMLRAFKGDSVTVSMAAVTKGTLSSMLRENLVFSSTVFGSTSE